MSITAADIVKIPFLRKRVLELEHALDEELQKRELNEENIEALRVLLKEARQDLSNILDQQRSITF
jgi:dsDNA-binding SOS-regulon protein